MPLSFSLALYRVPGVRARAYPFRSVYACCCCCYAPCASQRRRRHAASTALLLLLLLGDEVVLHLVDSGAGLPAALCAAVTHDTHIHENTHTFFVDRDGRMRTTAVVVLYSALSRARAHTEREPCLTFVYTLLLRCVVSLYHTHTRESLSSLSSRSRALSRTTRGDAQQNVGGGGGSGGSGAPHFSLALEKRAERPLSCRVVRHSAVYVCVYTCVSLSLSLCCLLALSLSLSPDDDTALTHGCAFMYIYRYIRGAGAAALLSTGSTAAAGCRPAALRWAVLRCATTYMSAKPEPGA